MKKLCIDDDALRRLSAFKQPRRSSFTIGELVQEQLDGPAIRQARLLAHIGSALQPLVDEVDRPHCRVVKCVGGRVTIQVDDPALVPAFTRKYLFALRDRLSEALPQGRIREIKFTALA